MKLINIGFGNLISDERCIAADEEAPVAEEEPENSEEE